MTTSTGTSIPSPIPTIKLHNGVNLPVISLGTAHVILEEGDVGALPRFQGLVPERAYRQVQLALEKGIRSFETARIYRTHRQIGHVLGEWFRQGLLKDRSDVFLTTKVYHGSATRVALPSSHMHNMEEMSEAQVTAQVTKELDEAFVDLGVGYIDLMLLHWPGSANVLGDKKRKRDDENTSSTSGGSSNRKRRLAAWKVLEEYYEKGWLRAIGVSNFSEHHLEQLREDGATIMPMVNQIEASLSVQYPKIAQYCAKHDIVCQAFSPFKRGDLSSSSTSDEILDPIMKKYDKTIAQIAMRYLIQKGFAVIFLSTNAERMIQNHGVFDFEFTDEELGQIDTLPREDGNWGLPTPYDIE